MALRVVDRFVDTFNYKGQEVTIEVVKQEGKARRGGEWQMVKYTSGSCSMFPEIEWTPSSVHFGDSRVDSRSPEFHDMDILVSRAIDDFLGRSTGDFEKAKAKILGPLTEGTDFGKLDKEEAQIKARIEAGKINSLNELVDFLETHKTQYSEINGMDAADFDDFLFWADELLESRM